MDRNSKTSGKLGILEEQIEDGLQGASSSSLKFKEGPLQFNKKKENSEKYHQRDSNSVQKAHSLTRNNSNAEVVKFMQPLGTFGRKLTFTMKHDKKPSNTKLDNHNDGGTEKDTKSRTQLLKFGLQLETEKLAKLKSGSMYVEDQPLSEGDDEEDQRTKIKSEFEKNEHKFSDLLKSLTEEQLLNKAVRHLKDALFYRRYRNDLDKPDAKFANWAYNVQTHLTWNSILFYLNWVFLLTVFWEPINSVDSDYFERVADTPIQKILLVLEVVPVTIFCIDAFLEMVHRLHDDSKPFWKRYFCNTKAMIKLISCLLFVADLIIFYASRITTWRFSRFARPIPMFLYSKEYRRTVESLVKSAKKIITLLLFFVIACAIFATIGVRFIGDLDGEIPFDKYMNNFDHWGYAFNAQYLLLTGEGYPEVVQPAIEQTMLYMFYFVPILVLNLIILLPVPVAVFFKAFCSNRTNNIFSDELRERDALFACYLTLTIHEPQGRLYIQEFTKFMEKAFPEPHEPTFYEDVFNIVDVDKSKYIVNSKKFFLIITTSCSLQWVDEFFEFPEIILTHPGFPSVDHIWISSWQRVKGYFNKYLKLEKIGKSKIYSSIMFALSFFNMVLTFAWLIENGPGLSTTFRWTSIILAIPFLLDTIIRVFTEGFQKYIQSAFNLCDIIGLIVFLNYDFLFSFLRIQFAYKYLFSSDKTHWKTFRTKITTFVTRTRRGALRYLMAPLRQVDSIAQELFTFGENLLVCIPIVLKLFGIIVIIFYYYSILAVEIFNKATELEEHSVYLQPHYTNFDTVGYSFLSLFQIILAQVWSQVYYDAAARYNVSFIWVAAYFLSFHTIVNLVIVNIIKGLIWEIFIVLDEDKEEAQKKQHEEHDKKRQQPEKTSAKKHTELIKIESQPHHLEKHLIGATLGNLKMSELENSDSEGISRLHHRSQSHLHESNNLSDRESVQEDITVEENLNRLKSMTRQTKLELMQFKDAKTITDYTIIKTPTQFLIQEADENLSRIDHKSRPRIHSQTDNNSVSQFNDNSFLNVSPTTIRRDVSAENRASHDPSIINPEPLLNTQVLDNPDVKAIEYYQLNLTLIDENEFALDTLELAENYRPLPLLIEQSPLDNESNNALTTPKTKKSNNDLIMKRAFLKKSNLHEFKKAEQSFLNNQYGELYQNAREKDKNNGQMVSLMDIENRIIVLFWRNVRLTRLSATHFARFLLKFEVSMMSNLVKKPGFVKFVFQAGNGRWFTLLGEDSIESVSFRDIKKGIWSYYSDLDIHEKNIYQMKSLQKLKESELQNFEYGEYQNELIKSLSKCCRYVRQDFEKFEASKFQMVLTATENYQVQFTETSLVEGYFSKLPQLKGKFDRFVVSKVVVLITMPAESEKAGFQRSKSSIMDLKKMRKMQPSADAIPDIPEESEVSIPIQEYYYLLKEIGMIISENKKEFFLKISKFYLETRARAAGLLD